MLKTAFLLTILLWQPSLAATAQPVALAQSPAEATEQQTAPDDSDVLIAEPAEDAAVKPAEQARPVALRSNSERPNAGISLGKMALSLLIVVLVVLALGWTFKKLTLRLPGSKHIKIISSLPLGPKERLLVIEIQGKQRVLGVTPQQINLLFELENPLPEEKLASDFHTQLQSFLKK